MMEGLLSQFTAGVLFYAGCRILNPEIHKFKTMLITWLFGLSVILIVRSLNILT